MQFTRPPRDRFIRIFEEGGKEVISINAATSLDVVYPSNTLGRTLIFSMDYYFPENQKFYVLLDQGNIICEMHTFTCCMASLWTNYKYTGVVAGTEFCNAESPALKDPTLWTFMIGKI